MNVRDTSYHGDALSYKTYDYLKGQKSGDLNTKPRHKLYKFDFKINVQGRIRIMNVIDICSHGERPIAKYGMQMSKLTKVKGRTCRHDIGL